MNLFRPVECVVLAGMAIVLPTGGAHGATLPVSLAACGFNTSPAFGPAAPRPIAAQVRHVEAAEITFHGSPTADGGIQIEGRGGDLVFRKRSHATGRLTIDLEAPGDRVGIALTEHAVTISRRGRRITIPLSGGSDRDLDNARVLLAGSSAVRLARVAAAAVQDAEDDSASSASLLMADALVGMLTGDSGAPGRVARHLSRHARTGIRRAATTDCYLEWEGRVLRSSFEWESCARSFSVWNPTRNLCAFRWLLQVESYWFTFISCTGFNAF
jgi:hypothetical protein